MNAPTTGAALIAAERSRQINEEGWTPDHDEQHGDDELARAAAIYATPSGRREYVVGRRETEYGSPALLPEGWPERWSPGWWKPGDGSVAGRIRELEKAGALVAAEIDRLLAEQAAHSVPTPDPDALREAHAGYSAAYRSPAEGAAPALDVDDIPF